MFLYVVHLLGYYISYNCVFSSGCMKVQFDQSSYSTVRKSSCLVYVHLLYIALCVCVGGGGGGWRKGVLVGVTLGHLVL